MYTAETIMPPSGFVTKGPRWVVIIAASTGGPQALAQLLPKFPSSFPGTIIVVQHMRQGFTRVLADMLNQTCNLPVHEPTDGQILQSSRILMVPSGCRFVFERNDFGKEGHVVLIEDVSEIHDARNTRTDATMTSIAEAFGKRTVGILLTGTGTDGREGMRAIYTTGGITFAQDADSSVVFDLPSSAIDANVIQEVLPLWNIADRVMKFVQEEANEVAA